MAVPLLTTKMSRKAVCTRRRSNTARLRQTSHFFIFLLFASVSACKTQGNPHKENANTHQNKIPFLFFLFSNVSIQLQHRKPTMQKKATFTRRRRDHFSRFPIFETLSPDFWGKSRIETEGVFKRHPRRGRANERDRFYHVHL